MKVILVNGSPHHKGCTFTALQEIEKELQAQGIDTAEKAQAISTQEHTDSKPLKKTQVDFAQHEYTDEQLNALFTNLENVDL